MPTTNKELSQILNFLDAQRPVIAPSDATRVQAEETPPAPQLNLPPFNFLVGPSQDGGNRPRREMSVSDARKAISDEEIRDLAMGLTSPGVSSAKAGEKIIKTGGEILSRWKGKRLMEAFDQRKREWTKEVLGGRFDDAGKFTKARIPKSKPREIPEVVNNKEIYNIKRTERYKYIPELNLDKIGSKGSFVGETKYFKDGAYTIREVTKVGAKKGSEILKMNHNYNIRLNDKFAEATELGSDIGTFSFTSRFSTLAGTKKRVPVIENVKFATGKNTGPDPMQYDLNNLSERELRRISIGAARMFEAVTSRFPSGTFIRFGYDKNKNSMTLDSLNFMISAISKYAKRVLLNKDFSTQVIKGYPQTGSASQLSKMTTKEAAEAFTKKFSKKLEGKAYGDLIVKSTEGVPNKSKALQHGGIDISAIEIELAAAIGIPLSQLPVVMDMIKEVEGKDAR